MCSVEPKEQANFSQGICGYLAILKLICFLKEWISVKNNRKASFIGDVFIVYGLQNTRFKNFLYPRSEWQFFNYGKIKQRIVLYDTGMYHCLPKISSKIEIFDSGYLSTRHSMFTSTNM
jgi:hypothetical protein